MLWTDRDRENHLRKAALAPLGLLSLLYGLLMRLRAGAYKAGLFTTRKVDARVIAIGNLTVGGSGKTGLVEWLARRLHEAGHRPAVILRGYKGRVGRDPLLVSDGGGPLVSAERAGDEAVMLAEKLAGVPVIAGPDRRRDALFALEKFGSTHLILDDGFQHLALARDLNLLVIESDRDLQNESLLPRGPLREPLPAAGRADALMLSRSRSGEGGLWPWLSRLCPGRPVFRMRYCVVSVYDCADGSEQDRETPALAFCGLGRPEGFFQDLVEAGVQVVARESFPDHYHYRREDLEILIERARAAGASRLLTSEKDAVKIKDEWRGGFPLHALRVEPGFFGHEEDLLRLAAGK